MLTIPYRSLVFAATIIVSHPVLHLDAQERQDVDSIALAMSNPNCLSDTYSVGACSYFS